MNKIFCVVFTFFILSIKLAVTNENELIWFATNLTRCRMYSDECSISFMLKNSSAISSLKVISTDLKLLTIKSIQSCSAENYKNCNTPNEFEKLSNHERKLYENNVFIVNLNPLLVGKILIEFSLGNSTYNQIVVVGQPKRFIDFVQQIYVVIFSLVTAIIMGILIEWEKLKKILKIPIPVIVGFLSQYLFMPLLAFGFISVFNQTPAEALAIFIYGCSPGGAGSNNWTIIFNGDIDLSVIMTFVSTMSSLFMMPAWVYSLGRVISAKAEIRIPFLNLIGNLLVTIIPCLIGIFLSKRFPKLKAVVLKYSKKIVFLLLIVFLTITTISKYYVFKLINLTTWFTVPIIPWSGFMLGGFFAFITKRPKEQIFTISVETGFQNLGVAFMITILNFPSPESDYAILPLIAIAILTTLPLWIALLVKFIYNKITEGKKNKNIKNDDAKINDENLTLPDNKTHDNETKV